MSLYVQIDWYRQDSLEQFLSVNLMLARILKYFSRQNIVLQIS